jgi:hypothetical protein
MPAAFRGSAGPAHVHRPCPGFCSVGAPRLRRKRANARPPGLTLSCSRQPHCAHVTAGVSSPLARASGVRERRSDRQACRLAASRLEGRSSSGADPVVLLERVAPGEGLGERDQRVIGGLPGSRRPTRQRGVRRSRRRSIASRRPVSPKARSFTPSIVASSPPGWGVHDRIPHARTGDRTIVSATSSPARRGALGFGSGPDGRLPTLWG